MQKNNINTKIDLNSIKNVFFEKVFKQSYEENKTLTMEVTVDNEIILLCKMYLKVDEQTQLRLKNAISNNICQNSELKKHITFAENHTVSGIDAKYEIKFSKEASAIIYNLFCICNKLSEESMLKQLQKNTASLPATSQHPPSQQPSTNNHFWNFPQTQSSVQVTKTNEQKATEIAALFNILDPNPQWKVSIDFHRNDAYYSIASSNQTNLNDIKNLLNDLSSKTNDVILKELIDDISQALYLQYGNKVSLPYTSIHDFFFKQLYDLPEGAQDSMEEQTIAQLKTLVLKTQQEKQSSILKL